MDQKNSAFVEKLTEVSGKIADNRYISGYYSPTNKG